MEIINPTGIPSYDFVLNIASDIMILCNKEKLKQSSEFFKSLFLENPDISSHQLMTDDVDITKTIINFIHGIAFKCDINDFETNYKFVIQLNKLKLNNHPELIIIQNMKVPPDQIDRFLHICTEPYTILSKLTSSHNISNFPDKLMMQLKKIIQDAKYNVNYDKYIIYWNKLVLKSKKVKYCIDPDHKFHQDIIYQFNRLEPPQKNQYLNLILQLCLLNENFIFLSYKQIKLILSLGNIYTSIIVDPKYKNIIFNNSSYIIPLLMKTSQKEKFEFGNYRIWQLLINIEDSVIILDNGIIIYDDVNGYKFIQQN